MKKQKIYPLLLILGASILLSRTIILLTIENGWVKLATWVIIFTFIEMIIDILCVVFSIKWLLFNSNISKTLSLRFGASAAIFHAFRVLIYVLGRTSPWINFDLKPEFRSLQNVVIFWVYFPAILSILGISGVFIIWRIIKKKNKENL